MRPGGQPSRLNIGQAIAVQHVAGSGRPSGRSRGDSLSNGSTADVPLDGVASTGGAVIRTRPCRAAPP